MKEARLDIGLEEDPVERCDLEYAMSLASLRRASITAGLFG